MIRLVLYMILVYSGLIGILYNFESFAESQEHGSLPTIDIQYTIDLGHDVEYVKYRICAADQTLYAQTALVSSPEESKQISTKIVLVANTCKDYNAIIQSKYSNTITVMILNVQS